MPLGTSGCNCWALEKVLGPFPEFARPTVVNSDTNSFQLFCIYHYTTKIRLRPSVSHFQDFKLLLFSLQLLCLISKTTNKNKKKKKRKIDFLKNFQTVPTHLKRHDEKFVGAVRKFQQGQRTGPSPFLFCFFLSFSPSLSLRMLPALFHPPVDSESGSGRERRRRWPQFRPDELHPARRGWNNSLFCPCSAIVRGFPGRRATFSLAFHGELRSPPVALGNCRDKREGFHFFFSFLFFFFLNL